MQEWTALGLNPEVTHSLLARGSHPPPPTSPPQPIARESGNCREHRKIQEALTISGTGRELVRPIPAPAEPEAFWGRGIRKS